MKPFTFRGDMTPSELNDLRENLLAALVADGLSQKEASRQLRSQLGDELADILGVVTPPDDFLLSVVIPVFNEARTCDQVIERVRKIGLPLEMVLVDDGSSDGSRDLLQTYTDDEDIRVILHEKNRGKGAAITTGFANVGGNVVVIQDADLEYDPRDFCLLIAPFFADEADVVYGSRFSGSRKASPFWHRSGNRTITRLANVFTGLKFTDVETCYKMFRRDLIDQITPTLKENRFGIEIEISAKLAKLPDVRFFERPISYDKRGYDEGKKIGLRDAFRALYCMVRY